MNGNIEIVDPGAIEWSQGASTPPGCWGKSIYRYDEGRLGNVGKACPYTIVNKFDAGAFYTPLLVIGQPIEFYVVSGSLRIDETDVSAGHWARDPLNNSSQPAW